MNTILCNLLDVSCRVAVCLLFGAAIGALATWYTGNVEVGTLAAIVAGGWGVSAQ